MGDETEVIFPAVAQPPMRTQHVGPGAPGEPVSAILDNRSGLPDHAVRQAIEERWVEMAGLQFTRPNTFQLYSNNQGSMLAKTPFRTPTSVIEEVELARSIADTDDDVGATMGEMIAIAFGEGLTNHHRDENTLEFFNQFTGPTAPGIDVEQVCEEMYREYLIAQSVTTLTLFSRNRLQYWPLKSEEPVGAQLQVPNVGVLPAENIRIITNDAMGTGQLAFEIKDYTLKGWVDKYLDPNTPQVTKDRMAIEEPVAAALFTGKVDIPWNDSDPFSAGKVLYTLNPRMVHRTTAPKGAAPYPRPLLTRNFALLEAKRLLNIMDYALLQGGTNYIVIAKKGSDELPAQQPEIDNLSDQVRHASRSGVLVGDHRLSIEIVTPKLEELLNPGKRKLLGRKIAMGLLRQSEQNTGDPGTQGAANEMELMGRVISSDRRKVIRHAQSTFYDETATRNRSVFKQGAPSIWAPKIILAGVKDFWANVLQASDRGLIPHRWAVEALGFDYDAGLAEREREIARGDEETLTPSAVPFSSPEAGPQDNNSGRPPGSSSNNGRNGPSQGDRVARPPRRVIGRVAGETVTAMVNGTEVTYVGETTRALLEEYDETAQLGYVTRVEREAIEDNQTLRAASSVVVPVNPHMPCRELRAVRLDEGLSVVVGQRIGDDAMVAKALRFKEPQFDLHRAGECAIRWGFLTEPLVELADQRKPKRCKNCGNELPSWSPMNPVCPYCGAENTRDAEPDNDVDDSGGGGKGGGSAAGGEAAAAMATAFTEALRPLIEELARSRETPAPTPAPTPPAPEPPEPTPAPPEPAP